MAEPLPYEIRTIEDLVRLLQTEPQWVERLRQILFTKQLLQLPEVLERYIAANEERIAQLDELLRESRQRSARLDELQAESHQRLARLEELQAENQRLLAASQQRLAWLEELLAESQQRLARLEELQAESQQRLARLEELQAESQQRLARLEELQAASQQRLARLEELYAQGQERLNRLEELLLQMQQRQDSFEERLDNMTRILNELAERVTKLEIDVAYLKGGFMEIRAMLRAGALFGRNLRKARAVDMGELADQLYEAMEAGRITDEDLSILLETDLIVHGFSRDKEARPMYLTVEVSYVIDEYDVERAAARARLLQKALSVDTIPVVIGNRLTAEAHSLSQTYKAQWILVKKPT
ncbi:MAG: hypothetical protein N3A68_05570 [Bacteroidia bacterium]|nr:hypothetical protein [Bacteroidia bacterium]